MKEILESSEVQEKLNKLGVTLVLGEKGINIKLDATNKGSMLEKEEKSREATEYLQRLLSNNEGD